MYSEVYSETVFIRIEMSGDKLFHTGNAVRVSVSKTKRVEMGLKGIEMSSLYSEVDIKTVFAITEMSRDKLLHTGNARTSVKS